MTSLADLGSMPVNAGLPARQRTVAGQRGVIHAHLQPADLLALQPAAGG